MTSSVVAKIVYNRKKAALRVWFVSGSIYEYRKVLVEVYEAMLAAGSQGVYLNTQIKDHYSYRRIA